MNTSI